MPAFKTNICHSEALKKTDPPESEPLNYFSGSESCRLCQILPSPARMVCVFTPRFGSSKTGKAADARSKRGFHLGFWEQDGMKCLVFFFLMKRVSVHQLSESVLKDFKPRKRVSYSNRSHTDLHGLCWEVTFSCILVTRMYCHAPSRLNIAGRLVPLLS